MNNNQIKSILESILDIVQTHPSNFKDFLEYQHGVKLLSAEKVAQVERDAIQRTAEALITENEPTEWDSILTESKQRDNHAKQVRNAFKDKMRTKRDQLLEEVDAR